MASPSTMALNKIRLDLARYELPFIFALGNLSNLANIIVFLRQTLKANVCSWYFICVSVNNLLILYVIDLTQISSAAVGGDIFRANRFFCKLRGYFFELSVILSRHFICLITIDRWMVTSSSAWLRRQSSRSRARAAIIGSLAFWLIFNTHSLVGYDTGAFGCIATGNPVYGLFYSIYCVITSILPLVFMVLFSVLTLLNVRSSVTRQIHPHPSQTTDVQSLDTQRTLYINSHAPNHQQERHQKLTRIALLQVAVFVLLNLTWSAFPFYALLVYQQETITIDQILIMAGWSGIGLNLLSTYSALTLIVYTLASKKFRREFISAMNDIGKSIYQRAEVLLQFVR